jgi:Protein of unknown function (DUF2970)
MTEHPTQTPEPTNSTPLHSYEQEKETTLTTPLKKGTGFGNILLSALAALFGIQSEKNRARDFQQGKPSDFIMVGIFGVFFLIIGVIFLVKWVLRDVPM